MATNFFERQSTARRNTSYLVVLFALAVIGIVGTTVAVTAIALGQYRTRAGAFDQQFGGGSEPYPWQVPLFAGGGALALIGGGTLTKVIELRAGGGQGVAERLGGKRLLPDSRQPDERKLLNVVEEMAIASGVPVPPVYLLDEPGINAFAAGYNPSDAVLGVTRGAVQNLSRDELQGVIAHEFSHLLNGDMRLNIRLIGILQGILLLGLVGRMLLRSGYYSSGGRDNKGSHAAIMVMALALVVLGFMGSVFGGLIKAAVSRQREYLADSSAVQFTRNPDGIGGALKKIGGWMAGSQVQAPAAAEASHMFFAQGVWEGLSGLMATHPPLEARIRAIDPQWDGKFPEVDGRIAQANVEGPAAAAFAGNVRPAVAAKLVDLAAVDTAVSFVGDPREVHRKYAAALVASIPQELLDAAREPFGARAVVFGLLLDKQTDVRERQLAALTSTTDERTLAALGKLRNSLALLDQQARLPLLDLTLPALRSMSAPQHAAFAQALRALMDADQRLSLFEWTLGQVVHRHLATEFHNDRRQQVNYYGLAKLGQPLSQLLSTLAHAGHSEDQAATAFATGRRQLNDVPMELVARTACDLTQLQQALAQLSSVVEKHRLRIVDACAAVICADGRVNIAEAELLRGVADLLDCPMPPILPGQQVEASAEFRALGAQ